MFDRIERAKQFAPFDALTGLRLALRKKEIEHERREKIELSDEQKENIESALNTLSVGDDAKITCFEKGYYIIVQGKIKKIDAVYKYILIGDGKIMFNDLYSVEKL